MLTLLSSPTKLFNFAFPTKLSYHFSLCRAREIRHSSIISPHDTLHERLIKQTHAVSPHIRAHTHTSKIHTRRTHTSNAHVERTRRTHVEHTRRTHTRRVLAVMAPTLGSQAKPTIEEVKNWGADKLLEWIQQNQPNLLEGDNRQKFEAEYITGNVFLNLASDMVSFKSISNLPSGVIMGLANLAKEIMQREATSMVQKRKAQDTGTGKFTDHARVGNARHVGIKLTRPQETYSKLEMLH